MGKEFMSALIKLMELDDDTVVYEKLMKLCDKYSTLRDIADEDDRKTYENLINLLLVC